MLEEKFSILPFVCWKVCIFSLLLGSHNLSVRSSEQDAIISSSGANLTHLTQWLCPVKELKNLLLDVIHSLTILSWAPVTSLKNENYRGIFFLQFFCYTLQNIGDTLQTLGDTLQNRADVSCLHDGQHLFCMWLA